jgi:hypothetical protein
MAWLFPGALVWTGLLTMGTLRNGLFNMYECVHVCARTHMQMCWGGKL